MLLPTYTGSISPGLVNDAHAVSHVTAGRQTADAPTMNRMLESPREAMPRRFGVTISTKLANNLSEHHLDMSATVVPCSGDKQTTNGDAES